MNSIIFYEKSSQLLGSLFLKESGVSEATFAVKPSGIFKKIDWIKKVLVRAWSQMEVSNSSQKIVTWILLIVPISDSSLMLQ